MSDLTNKYIPFIDNIVPDGYEVVYISNIFLKNSVVIQQKLKISVIHFLTSLEFWVLKKVNFCSKRTYFTIVPYHLNFEGIKLKSEMLSNQLSSYLNLLERNK